MATDETLARLRRHLHAVGHKLYGKRWNVARHCLVGELTSYQTDSSNDCDIQQLRELITEVERRAEDEHRQSVSIAG
jgi:hypothetical protein